MSLNVFLELSIHERRKSTQRNVAMEKLLTKSKELQNIQISQKRESTNDQKDVTDNVTLLLLSDDLEQAPVSQLDDK